MKTLKIILEERQESLAQFFIKIGIHAFLIPGLLSLQFGLYAIIYWIIPYVVYAIKVYIEDDKASFIAFSVAIISVLTYLANFVYR